MIFIIPNKKRNKMRTFKLIIEVCITGIKRYDYTFKKTDTTKQMTLQRERNNRFDKNAIVVKLNGIQIGYVKKNEAKILAPILDTNALKVKKWLCDEECSTSGYMIAQLYLVS